MKRKEIFKSIDGYEGLYEISNNGRIKSFQKYGSIEERILTPVINAYGYLVVTLYKNSIPTGKRINRLVAIAFIPNPENKSEVNHVKGNKLDNRDFMLEWSTTKENAQHAYDIGLNIAKKGESHWNGKMTEEDINTIRNSTLLQKELAVIYNVSQQTISSIVTKKRWKHI